METIVPATLFVTGAFAASLLALVAISRGVRRAVPQASADDLPAVIIDGEDIIEANFSARHLILRKSQLDGLAAIRSWLAQNFHDAGRLTAPARDAGDRTGRSRDGTLVSRREVCGDAVRISVERALDDQARTSAIAMEDMAELATLRANTGLSPFPLWRANAEGEIIWVNQAYLDAARARHGADAVRRWPIPHLFDELATPGRLAPGTTRRLSLVGSANGRVSWFDCRVIEVDGDMLYTAMNIDEIVQAEGRLREVTQTLTKTFANLTIGLAVFGRQRNLTLFNPALAELTGLPIDFLTSRPGLAVFLDRLREERMMPEPRDYKSWRDHLAQLEAEAVDGTFEETWTMPGGETWRVTGRPHPDGAIAILFEDISLEMSLTRRFHQDLEQSQEILDSLDDAIAVFGIDGQVVQTNAAYDRLWRRDADGVETAETLREATSLWHKLTSPTPVWGDFRDFASETRDRLEWSAEARLLDGRRITCHFSPISNGATMARFALDPAQRETRPTEVREAV